MALFFALAKGGERAGWVGQITSNSFMKREFGTKLVEDFLAHQDLRLVTDTSGAYIPGHGTPTVIIVGRNQRPVGPTVRAVLGVRGEPGRPDDPAKGIVWTSIVEHIDEPAGMTAGLLSLISTEQSLDVHPWSLSGGGAVELLSVVIEQQLQAACVEIAHIGVDAVREQIGADDVFVLDASNRSMLRADRLATYR